MTVVTGNLLALLSRARLTLAPPPGKSPVRRIRTILTKLAAHSHRLTFLLFATLFFALVLALFSRVYLAQSPKTNSSPEVQERQELLVHYGDVIDVDVLGGFEFDWRGTITPEGNLDGISTFDEPIYALCRTEREIAIDVSRAYAKILRDPKVEVRIIDRSNRALARLDGAVRAPTRFGIRRGVRLQELLVLAGGIVNGASGEINIFRPENLSCRGGGEGSNLRQDNRSQTTTIKISDLLSGKSASNPIILSGDIVTVARAAPVYVIGAVNNPGTVHLTSDLTLGRAIATAGGLTKDADGRVITIFRRTGSGTSAREIDLAKIKSGELEDEVLRSFDIIDVPAKGGRKRSFPPASPFTGPKDANWAQIPLKIVD